MTSFSQGVFLFVTKCDIGGGGLKNAQFCVTSFMNGPLQFSVLPDLDARESAPDNCCVVALESPREYLKLHISKSSGNLELRQ